MISHLSDASSAGFFELEFEAISSSLEVDKVETAMARMHDRVDKVATTWLPPRLSKNIAEFEQGNFLNLVRAIEAVADACPDAAAACSKQDVLLDADVLLDNITTCAPQALKSSCA